MMTDEELDRIEALFPELPLHLRLIGTTEEAVAITDIVNAAPALCEALREARAEIEELKAELSRLAVFAAIHGVGGYRFVDESKPAETGGGDDKDAEI